MMTIYACTDIPPWGRLIQIFACGLGSPTFSTVQNFSKIGSGVPELEDPAKWHFPLKAFIALTTVLRYRADCDYTPSNVYFTFLVLPSPYRQARWTYFHD